MSEWWLRLQSRERVLVILMSLLILATLLYQLVWRGLGGDLERQQQRQVALQAELEWMRSAALEVRALQKADRRTPSTASLLSLVDRASVVAKLKPAIRKLSPDGDRLVRLSFDPIEFSRVLQLISWLHQRGIQVEEMQLSRDDAAGKASGRLTLVQN